MSGDAEAEIENHTAEGGGAVVSVTRIRYVG